MEAKTITSKRGGIKFRIHQPNSVMIYVEAKNCQPSWIGQLHIISALQDQLGLEYSRHVHVGGVSAMAYYLGNHSLEDVTSTLENYEQT